jgi:uncharacterized protein
MRTSVRIAVGRSVVSLLSVISLAAARDVRVVDAVKNQDRQAVRALLREHADVNVPQPDGATALHWAAHRDDLETASLLIGAGANVNAANELGVTPLQLACTNRSAPMVEKLLASGANPNAALPSGESALMTAARTGSVDVVKALLAHGANPNATEPTHGQTALMWAVTQQHHDVVRTLIEVGADVHATSAVRHRRVQLGMRAMDHDAKSTGYAEFGGFTPLLFAARAGDIESARLLLAAGSNVNEAAGAGTTALVVAAHSNQGAFARFMLDKGADGNADGAGYTALHAAVLRGDLTLVKALLDHGANANAPIKQATPVTYASRDYAFSALTLGATPFWLAARYGEPDIMRVLATHGADPRRSITDGTTPLMIAISGGGSGLGGATTTDRRERFLTPTELADISDAGEERVSMETAKAALELGADVNASSQSGETPLHGAAARGYVTIVRFLIEKGADVSAANKAGDTPLHSAAARGSTTVIQLLVDKNASVEAKNKKGQTPLAVASVQPVRIGGGNALADENRKAAGELLRKLGAKE